MTEIKKIKTRKENKRIGKTKLTSQEFYELCCKRKEEYEKKYGKIRGWITKLADELGVDRRGLHQRIIRMEKRNGSLDLVERNKKRNTIIVINENKA